MNKENCALKLVHEIILYYDAGSKKHQITYVKCLNFKLYYQQLHLTYLSDLASYELPEDDTVVSKYVGGV